ncbi:MAG: S-methyl-5'-thioinosine phosphorylase [Acidiferrobacterales bacterium]|nr:S-methyl-5'-thioinosine phosphorylase [Acidiferrobacterales bacterium]
MKYDTAIIGGTGFDQIDGLKVLDRKVVRTPYGDPSGVVISGKLDKSHFVFLPRHGTTHSIPPHKVNYRANIWALKHSGVKRVIGFAAVGGISEDLIPGTIVIPDQIIDYTRDRAHTFFDGTTGNVTHIDFTEPYTASLRARVLAASDKSEVSVVSEGCYAATQGPRLETAAEIDRLERDGATIVGMTGMPEAALAREMDMDYVCIAIVVNAAAGRGTKPITMTEIRKELKRGAKEALRILVNL